MYDSKRQERLERYGVQFLRFDNLDVKKKIAYVLDEIVRFMQQQVAKAQ